MTGEQDREVFRPQPLSPELRMEAARLDDLTAQATLLAINHIKTMPQLESFIDSKTAEIASLEEDRQQCYNRLRTAKSPESASELKTRAKDITRRIKPLRKDLKTAEKARKRSEYLTDLLNTERTMEMQMLQQERAHRERDRGWER